MSTLVLRPCRLSPTVTVVANKGDRPHVKKYQYGGRTNVGKIGKRFQYAKCA